MIRGEATPPKSRLHPIALIEDEEGIQASLMEVINALIRNTIDFRRAQLILRALHIAVKNSPRVHFPIHEREMVREVPDYPAAPATPKPPFTRSRPGWRALANPAAQASEYHSSPATHRRRLLCRSPIRGAFRFPTNGAWLRL